MPYYNGSNSFLYANEVKMYQFKEKDLGIKHYPAYLGNNSKNFKIDDIVLNEYGHVFSLVYIIIDVS